MNNWEGGIRGNGWISGGFLPTSVRGTVYNGLTTAWDWCVRGVLRVYALFLLFLVSCLTANISCESCSQ